MRPWSPLKKSKTKPKWDDGEGKGDKAAPKSQKPQWQHPKAERQKPNGGAAKT